MKRENFQSRLGFILLSAGCAIGIGNVWRFPYVVGNNGGGAFVLVYLLFLIAVGIPVLTVEFAIGRASRKSILCAYKTLQPKRPKWQLHGWAAFIGNYILMMYYTTISGWMLYYFYRYVTGAFVGATESGIGALFEGMLQSPGTMMFWTTAVIVLGMLIVSLGLQNGVEKITKYMMLALLVLLVVLAGRSLLLPGGMEGLRFYLWPDLARMREVGIGSIIAAAMNQSFFTLSIGIGGMLIFGSYIGRDKRLLGEAVTVAGLDSFVALVAGIVIFPACFAFGISPDSGPGLVFVTLPNVFGTMGGGRIWGSVFFLLMTFASLSTVIAVLENIITCCTDKWQVSRKKAAIVNALIIIVGSIPCVLGFNLLSGFEPLGAGSGVLDLEDFIISNLLMPLGSLVLLFFCVSRWGWGFDKYLAETNTGSGWKMPKAMRFYMKWVLPILIIVIFVQGLWGVVSKLL